MTRLTVDPDLRSKLHDLTELVELCDESGRVLARVVPAVDLSEYEPLVPQISDEELRRRFASEEKGYTTAEVLLHLRNL